MVIWSEARRSQLETGVSNTLPWFMKCRCSPPGGSLLFRLYVSYSQLCSLYDILPSLPKFDTRGEYSHVK